jgi:glucose-6-phosphate 1-dehydrogenase
LQLAGVPFYIRAGKQLSVTVTEVLVAYIHKEQMLDDVDYLLTRP